jgi:uncharacterized membrane protein (DUF4010 family)
MLDFIDPVAQPGAALVRVLAAGLLGGLIGVERERAGASGAEHFAGVRTFPLFAILGAGLTLLSGSIGVAPAAGFLAVAALVVTAYVRSSGRGDVGATTEAAALVTYWIGAAAGAGALLLAGALAIGVTVLLAAKERLEAFPRALSRRELEATLTLAVIAVVILPVLPDRGYGPWEVWNPRRLWGMVVLVCGLSFAAFIAMRLWGHTKGLAVSGLLGGLVSSTAATVSFAQRSRQAPAAGTALAVAGGLASLVMIVRVAVLTFVAAPALLGGIAPFLGATAAAGGVVLALLARRARGDGESLPTLTNPFELRAALQFAAIYALVLLVVEAASVYLGAWGVVIAAVLAGLTDVDAITLSVAALSRGSLAPEVAIAGIAAAALSNTAAKAAYAAWLGAGSFRRGMLQVLGAAFAAGLVALIVTLVLARG